MGIKVKEIRTKKSKNSEVRLVASNMQKQAIDFQKMFALVARYETIRALLSASVRDTHERKCIV